MKIIITENQNYLLRRLQQFIDVVEDMINDYELQDNHPWWCRNNNLNSFYYSFEDRCIEEFINENWDFFHDDSERGGANMDINMLYNIIEENYGNYIRNLFVRKCNKPRY